MSRIQLSEPDTSNSYYARVGFGIELFILNCMEIFEILDESILEFSDGYVLIVIIPVQRIKPGPIFIQQI